MIEKEKAAKKAAKKSAPKKTSSSSRQEAKTTEQKKDKCGKRKNITYTDALCQDCGHAYTFASNVVQYNNEEVGFICPQCRRRNKEAEGFLAKQHKRPPRSELGKSMQGVQKAVNPGDNARIIGVGMRLMALPRIDITDADQVRQQIADFFRIYYEEDLKPTVNGFALVLGMDRQDLTYIQQDRSDLSHSAKVRGLSPEICESIKEAYNFLKVFWEDYMQNGKINPIAGIFLGKNHFGYTDTIEHVSKKTDDFADDISVDELKKRYLEGVGEGPAPQEEITA